ncbi:MAG: cardiolipin synthase ClsB [Polaromonas sp.]
MTRWVGGNRFRLLENGEEFFPRVFECIAAAQHEVVLETFILFEDKVGMGLHAALLQAAGRGAQIDITVDGYGSPDLSPGFLSALTQAGVRVHVFDPGPKLWGWRTKLFRRMHRKIVVVDGQRAFVGGINYSADHLADFGPMAKQDYSVEMEGPIVGLIHEFVHQALVAGQRAAAATLGSRMREGLSSQARKLTQTLRRVPAAPVGAAGALFVTRDNGKHTKDIEHHYRIAIRSARHRIVIANAYFFPGYRLLREMRRAAGRGVDVRLILQGKPDKAIVKTAANMLYHYLLTGGVQIFEYSRRPLHGKVAVADDAWSTVGSSNLDPLSLSLNLEANVVIKDCAFNQHLSARLEDLMQRGCRQIRPGDLVEPNWWRMVRSFFVFHLLRRYPAWAGWLPGHAQRLSLAMPINPNGNPDVADTDAASQANSV